MINNHGAKTSVSFYRPPTANLKNISLLISMGALLAGLLLTVVGLVNGNLSLNNWNIFRKIFQSNNVYNKIAYAGVIIMATSFIVIIVILACNKFLRDKGQTVNNEDAKEPLQQKYDEWNPGELIMNNFSKARVDMKLAGKILDLCITIKDNEIKLILHQTRCMQQNIHRNVKKEECIEQYLKELQDDVNQLATTDNLSEKIIETRETTLSNEVKHLNQIVEQHCCLMSETTQEISRPITLTNGYPPTVKL